jgi:DMSO/TMAO reductase YedYZ molybdopterin-dependent catalytic subunit
MVPEQHWEGVPATATLGCAGVDPVACFLKVYAGNFAVLLPLQKVLHGGAILARTLNGTPLTPEHGARDVSWRPVRRVLTASNGSIGSKSWPRGPPRPVRPSPVGG